MLDFDQVVKQRHSTRMFLPKPVPRELLEEAVALAQLAPSNSNIQPWNVVFVAGPTRDRLVAAMLEEAELRPPNILLYLSPSSTTDASCVCKSMGLWEFPPSK